MVLSERSKRRVARRGQALTWSLAVAALVATPLLACPPKAKNKQKADAAPCVQKPRRAPASAPAAESPGATTFDRFMESQQRGDGDLERRLRELERRIEQLQERLRGSRSGALRAPRAPQPAGLSVRVAPAPAASPVPAVPAVRATPPAPPTPAVQPRPPRPPPRSSRRVRFCGASRRTIGARPGGRRSLRRALGFRSRICRDR